MLYFHATSFVVVRHSVERTVYECKSEYGDTTDGNHSRSVTTRQPWREDVHCHVVLKPGVVKSWLEYHNKYDPGRVWSYKKVQQPPVLLASGGHSVSPYRPFANGA